MDIDKILYFSFVTLTSIGYGDITPVTPLPEKVTAFFGLIGHFYSVVVVIIGKDKATAFKRWLDR